MLYRITYVRDGQARGATFGAENLPEALEFARFWERICKVEVLTLWALKAKPVQQEMQPGVVCLQTGK